jgi:hypothetical protein
MQHVLSIPVAWIPYTKYNIYYDDDKNNNNNNNNTFDIIMYNSSTWTWGFSCYELY